MGKRRQTILQEGGVILIGMQRDNVGASDTGENYKPLVWRAGEIVNSYDDTQKFGFMQMPVNPFGARTVAEVNAIDVSNIPIYSGVQLQDSGTITSGAGDDVPVVTGDVIVLNTDDSWTNHGPRTDVPDIFFHIRISDKTLAEVEAYLESFNKKLTYESNQFDPDTDMRRFTTTNVRVSASGNNGFSAEGINNAINEWNTNYPDNTVTLVDTDNLTYFQVDGIMPIDLFDEWKENTQRVALADYYRKRRWYITQAGLDALAANDWVLNGTAADVAPFLRDGLLD